MTDVYGPEKRSAVMARVKSKDTSPEMKVRRALTALGAERDLALGLGFLVCLAVRAASLRFGWALPRHRPRSGLPQG